MVSFSVVESVSDLIKNEKRKMKKGREGSNRKYSEQRGAAALVCLQQEVDLVTHCHTVTNCSNLHHMQNLFRARPKAVTGIRLI